MSSDNTQVALVTGATRAIGQAIANQLAAKQVEVVLAIRDVAKAKKVVQEIISKTGNQQVRYELVDVSRESSVKALAERWQGPLHVLVNNAAVTPRSRQETPEGLELQFATNVLGYFWMTLAFLEPLRQSAPARIVDVASYYAGDLDLNDLQFKRRSYNNNTAYRQSKQANRMLTVAFAKRLESYGISINVCHPGNVNSRLGNNLGFRGGESPDEGADTPVWLATSPAGQEKTGKYFTHRREERCRFGEDQVAVEQLYRLCLEFSPTLAQTVPPQA